MGMFIDSRNMYECLVSTVEALFSTVSSPLSVSVLIAMLAVASRDIASVALTITTWVDFCYKVFATNVLPRNPSKTHRIKQASIW